MTEMAARWQGHVAVGVERDRVQTAAAIPNRCEAATAQKFPAMAVRDVHRQTPVGEALCCGLHPAALERCGPDTYPLSIGQIADQLGSIF